jgi:membrane fusion protein (multidrug efflux system)
MADKPARTSAETTLPENVPAKPPAGKRKARLIFAVVLLAALGFGARMWWRSQNFEETDNAYLAAHVSVVSPRISGVVTRVLVDDNQWVKAGDPLVELDPADQQVKVDQIEAQLAQADEQIRQIDVQVKQFQAEALAAKSLVARAAALRHRNDAEAKRVSSLYEAQVNSVSKSEVEAAIAARDSAAAEMQAQEYQASAAAAKRDAMEATRATVAAQKKVLASQLQEAGLQMKYTRILAPVTGRVGRKNVEVGTRLQPGQQVLAIVQDGVWVNANFKETQVRGLHSGQRASVRIDAFPGEEFTGRVASFSPAAGAQFALLPPDNATGNFTRIVQRIPVKIVLDAESVKSVASRLAPGASAIVEIDLRQGNPNERTPRG